MLIHRIRHNFPTSANYNISRTGLDCYCFFHFSASTNVKLGDELIHTRPNACVLYKPGVQRQVMNYQPVLMNWAHLGTDICDYLEKYAIPLNRVFYVPDASFIGDIFRKLELEYFSSGPYSQKLTGCYMEEFFIKLNRALQQSGKTPEINSSEQLKIYRVRQSVLSQPGRKWTVEEMARHAALSPSRFHSVYKALFGTTPIRDVIEAKMDYAKTLLLAEDFQSIQDVTDKLGYKSPYYFITQFKAVTGVSPGVYRKNNR